MKRKLDSPNKVSKKSHYSNKIEPKKSFNQESILKEKESGETIVSIAFESLKSTLISGLFNGKIEIYDLEKKVKLHDFKAHNNQLTGLKYCPFSNNIITSSLDGTVCAWDSRTTPKKPVQKYSSSSKPILCFDVNEKLMVAGTELIEDDAFILFWDVRNTNLLGSYWESHSNDITQVRLNPCSKSILASSCSAGLINIFDLRATDEDDSLQTTLNVDSTITNLKWVKTNQEEQRVCCLTSDEILQLWPIEEVSPTFNFSRDEVKNFIDNTYPSDYFIDILCETEENLFATGNASGICSLWSLTEKPTLWAHLDSGNKDTIVRTISFSEKDQIIATGMDNGQLIIHTPSSY